MIPALLHAVWWLAVHWCTVDPTCGSSSLNQDAYVFLYLSPIFGLVLLMTDEAAIIGILLILLNVKERAPDVG